MPCGFLVRGKGIGASRKRVQERSDRWKWWLGFARHPIWARARAAWRGGPASHLRVLSRRLPSVKRSNVGRAILTAICTVVLTGIVAGLNGIAAAPAQTPAVVRIEEEPPESPNAREAWFYGQRAFPEASIPSSALRQAQEQQLTEAPSSPAASPSAPSLPLPTWQPLGPAPLQGKPGFYAGQPPWAGRITAVVVHPTNPNVIYVGGATGGVWRTTNGGGAWSPLTDSQPSLAIGSIALDPVNPNVLYAGTGEANSSDSYYGLGILKSTDGGASWQTIGASTFSNCHIAKIVVHPINSAQ